MQQCFFLLTKLNKKLRLLHFLQKFSSGKLSPFRTSENKFDNAKKNFLKIQSLIIIIIIISWGAAEDAADMKMFELMLKI